MNKIPEDETSMQTCFQRVSQDLGELLNSINTIKTNYVMTKGLTHVDALVKGMACLQNLHGYPFNTLSKKDLLHQCEQLERHATCISGDDDIKGKFIKAANYVSVVVAMCYSTQFNLMLV